MSRSHVLTPSGHKWQILRLDYLVSQYQRMISSQQKMAPIQDKIFKYVKRELEDIDEADSWKTTDEDDEYPYDEPNDPRY